MMFLIYRLNQDDRKVGSPFKLLLFLLPDAKEITFYILCIFLTFSSQTPIKLLNVNCSIYFFFPKIFQKHVQYSTPNKRLQNHAEPHFFYTDFLSRAREPDRMFPFSVRGIIYQKGLSKSDTCICIFNVTCPKNKR